MDIRPVGLRLWLLQTITNISVWVFMYTFSWYSFPECSPLSRVSVYSSTYISKNNYFNSHHDPKDCVCVCFLALINASRKHTRTSHPFTRFGALKLERNSCSSAVGICWAKILSGIPGKTNYSQRGNKEGINKRKEVIRSSRTKGQG